MSTAIATVPFPSDGKVLIIGLSQNRLLDAFENRTVMRNHWEIFLDTEIPASIAAVIFAPKVSEEHRIRLKSLAIRRRQEMAFYVELNPMQVRDRLNTILTGIDLGVDPDKPGTDARSGGGILMMSAAALVSVPVQGSEVSAKEMEGALLIPTARVRPLKDQPRSYFNKKKLAELKDSIAAIGQQMPIIVRRLEDDPGYDYELIEGERRLRVCTELEIPNMLACIRAVANAEEQFMSSFAANFAREGHTPLDTARAIAKILAFESFQTIPKTVRVKAVARIAGKTDVWAYQYLRLLQLPLEVQRLLEPDEDDKTPLPLNTGVFLCTIADAKIQLKVARASVEQDLSMAKAKQFARKLAIEAGLPAGSAERTPNKDYNIMRNYIRRTMEGAVNLLDMPHRSLDQLFEHRGPQERQQAVTDIDQAIKLLERLRSAVSLRQIQSKKRA